MKKIAASIAVFSSALAAPAAAEPVWRNIEFGMTRAQVEALYPEGDDVDYQPEAIELSDIQLTEECAAEVNIRFRNGAVFEVMIAGDPSMGGRCSDLVMTQLAAKYGQPSNWDSSAGSILGRQGKVAYWSRPGVAMRFKKFEAGFFGGGGLAKASWQLTYSQIDENLGL